MAERITGDHSTRGKPTAPQNAVLLDRLHRVLRTRGCVPAGGRQERADARLVEAQRGQHHGLHRDDWRVPPRAASAPARNAEKSAAMASRRTVTTMSSAGVFRAAAQAWRKASRTRRRARLRIVEMPTVRGADTARRITLRSLGRIRAVNATWRTPRPIFRTAAISADRRKRAAFMPARSFRRRSVASVHARDVVPTPCGRPSSSSARENHAHARGDASSADTCASRTVPSPRKKWTMNELWIVYL